MALESMRASPGGAAQVRSRHRALDHGISPGDYGHRQVLILLSLEVEVGALSLGALHLSSLSTLRTCRQDHPSAPNKLQTARVLQAAYLSIPGHLVSALSWGPLLHATQLL